ncbi:MAG: CocE/NonD family hydrolase [Victivallales bacterium]|nr:CocE/NonD family hydrolase [Victivallales bacterium]
MSNCIIFRNIAVKMRDGISLSTDVYLPAGTGTYPVVLVRTPYNRTAACGVSSQCLPYNTAFVVQDCRGRYDSEGEFYPFVNEEHDGYDTLQWLHNQTWCNGKTGMFGDSYLAATQLLTVPASNRFLSALNPRFMAADYWKRAYYCDGAFSLALTWSWLCFESASRISQAKLLPLMNVMNILRSLPLIGLDEASGAPIPFYRDYVSNSQYSDFWKRTNIKDRYDKFEMPVLLVGGWYDNYASEILNMFNGLRKHAVTPEIAASHRVLIGPWTHGINSATVLGNLDFGKDALLENDITFRWLTGILHGKPAAEIQMAPIRLFVMGLNRWRDEYEWPPARTRYEKYYLHKNNRISPEPPETDDGFEEYTYDPADPIPTLGGNHSIGAYNPGLYEHVKPGPYDQRPVEQRPDVLVFTSEKLEKDTEITGPVILKLYASSSAVDTDFIAKLTDVYPDGSSINLTEGIIRARFRDDVWGEPKLMVPETIYEFTIDMQATCNLFKRGHRIRVDIMSSNFPLWDRNLNTGGDPGTGTEMLVARQTVYHNSQYASHIILPIIKE